MKRLLSLAACVLTLALPASALAQTKGQPPSGGGATKVKPGTPTPGQGSGKVRGPGKVGPGNGGQPPPGGRVGTPR
jgi:hypothetical protein